jgi:dihydrofolate reductase
MRKLVLQMQVTLDGFVSGPEGELDWVFKTLDEASTSWIVDRLWQAGVHVMGRRTYHDMAAHWPTSTEPYAPPMNEIPKVVFSRTGDLGAARTTQALADATEARGGKGGGSPPPAVVEGWARPRVETDLGRGIARLKQEPGNEILAHGGASFARGLVAAGLVDELRLLVHPVVLGRGQALFSELPQPLDLLLVTATPFPAGTIALVYRRA